MTGRRVFRGARVLTLDPRQPWADSFAVENGRFAAIGDAAAVGASTALIDLGGAVVTPGFHDAHLHLSAGALTAAWVDLRGAPGPRDAALRVAGAARALAPGDWIRGWGWDHTLWSPPDWPSRGELDAAVPGHPAVLTRIDGHAAWLNSAALARLGWLEGADRPDRAMLGVDPRTGAPTGIALEQAAERAAAAVPPPGDTERRRAVSAALRSASALGVTSADDVAEPWALSTFEELRRADALPVRIHAWLPFDTPANEAAELRRSHPLDDAWVGAGTLKIFLDGTLGSRSAALFAEYSDAPGRVGELREDPSGLRPRIAAAHDGGWAVAIRAIGDHAAAVAIDLLSGLGPHPRGLRHRIEHVQVIRAREIARMARAGIVASVQPVHRTDDLNWIASRLGEDRDALVYPLRSLAAAGVPLAFGTDWPVAGLDPRANLRAAIRPERPDAEWDRREIVAAEEAWRAATSCAAVTRGATDRGRVEVGRHADFVVWDGDPLAAPGGGPPARVAATYVGGRRRFPETGPD